MPTVNNPHSAVLEVNTVLLAEHLDVRFYSNGAMGSTENIQMDLMLRLFLLTSFLITP